jgi:hypothetical protein
VRLSETSVGPASAPLALPRHRLRYGYGSGAQVPYRSRVMVQRLEGAGEHRLDEVEARVTLRVLERDSEGTCSVVSRLEPRSRRVDGRAEALPPGRVTYLRHDDRGEVLECSGPAGAAMLLLPADPVGVGSSWTVLQPHLPPGACEPLTVATHYLVERVDGARLHLSFRSEDLALRQDPLFYAQSAQGSLEFDWEDGLVVNARTETRTAWRSGGETVQVLTVQCLSLAV